jgi:hypothetical protein
MAELDEILKYWAADREGVSVLQISELKYDFDKGWPGTDVTPGDVPEIVITYSVLGHAVYRRDASELGNFIAELAEVAARGPFRAKR